MEKCEVFLLVDAGGDYVAHHDEDQLRELYEDCIDNSLIGSRVIKLVVDVEIPSDTVLTGKAPAAALQASMQVQG